MKGTRTKQSAARGIQYEPYENCPFCKGRGCFGCKERKRQDEDAARKLAEDAERLEQSRLFTAHLDNPEEMATLQEVFHADKLREYFDTSDLSEEDVYKWLGKGNVEDGKLTFLFALGVTSSRSRPLPGFGSRPQLSDEELRAELLAEMKRRLGAERADQRMREALRGKAGSKI